MITLPGSYDGCESDKLRIRCEDKRGL